MKKLLILTLVLGMASLASAAFSLVQIDATTAAVVNDTTGYNGAGWLTIDGGGVMSADYALTAAGDPQGDSSIGGTYLNSDFGDGFLWTDFSIQSLNPDNKVQAGNNIIISLTSGAGNVALYDESGYVQIGESVFLGIPEPATMALLGLGALVLRRKK